MKHKTIFVGILLLIILIFNNCTREDDFSGSSSTQVNRSEVGNLVLEGIPDIPPEVVQRTRQYTNFRLAKFAGWHPDGQGLYVAAGSQIHHVERPGGPQRQLTFFDDPVGEVVVRPAGRPAGFLFLKDVGGSEFYQIFYFDLVAGESRILTDGQCWKGGLVWSQGGDQFAYYSTARNGRDWDIYVSEVGNPGAVRMVLEAEGPTYPMEWSPDDSRLLVRQQVSWTESYLYVADLSIGAVTRLNPSDEKIAYGRDAAWSRDGLGVYFTSIRTANSSVSATAIWPAAGARFLPEMCPGMSRPWRCPTRGT